MSYYNDMEKYSEPDQIDEKTWVRILNILGALYELDDELRKSGEEYKLGMSSSAMFETFHVDYKSGTARKKYLEWLIRNNFVKEQKKDKNDKDKTRRYYITKEGREFYEKHAISYLRDLMGMKERKKEMVKAAILIGRKTDDG